MNKLLELYAHLLRNIAGILTGTDANPVQRSRFPGFSPVPVRTFYRNIPVRHRHTDAG